MQQNMHVSICDRLKKTSHNIKFRSFFEKKKNN